MKIKAVVFDFDGVLTVGGEGLKQMAWNLMSESWLYYRKFALERSIDKYSGGKGSRYDILNEVFSDKKPEDREILVKAFAECYNSIVQQLLEKSGMPEGALEILKHLVGIYGLYVNSATPEKAVRESIFKFGINQFFSGIFGQPASKLENLKKILSFSRRYDLDNMVFVGDGENDFKAARAFGCRFIGVANDWNKWKQGEENRFPLISSIRELPDLLQKMSS